MLRIPLLHPHPQTTRAAQTARNHRHRPWRGLRSLVLLLTIILGLSLLQPALAALFWQIRIVDNSSGRVGIFASLALDNHSNPVISYNDFDNGDLKLAHCGDATCASGNSIVTVDSAGFVGEYTSLALDNKGNPVISYFDSGNFDLKVVHCGDAICSSGNTFQTVDSAGSVGEFTSLALDSNGNPVISYFDASNGDLKVAHCGDATCSSGNSVVTVDSAGGVGTYSSLALDSNGYPVVSYHDDTNLDLKLVHCGDATCSSGNTIVTVDNTQYMAIHSSLALDSNGYPVISYYDEANFALKVAHCGDARCSSNNTFSLVDQPGDVGTTSLVLNSSGYPVISYLDVNRDKIKLARCGDANCASGNTLEIVADAGAVGGFPSLKLESSGKPVIAYYDDTHRDLAIARLMSDDSTPPMITPSVTGTAGNNGWYTSDVIVSWNVVDDESAVSVQNGCDTTVLTSDTAGITLTCTATSAGGTASQSVTLKLDKTPPALAPVVSPNPVQLGAAASVTSDAMDALSGLASQNCGLLDTSSVGVKQVTCTAVDNAGNTASVTVNYTVAYPWSGFLSPVDNPPTVNTVNAGTSIPVKFSLGGDFGLNLFATGYPKVQTFACGSSGSGSSDPIEETVTAGNSALQYDPTRQTYTYIWKTNKSLAGTCRQLIVRLVDGVDHIALFQFNGKVRSADADQGEVGVQQIFLPLINR